MNRAEMSVRSRSKTLRSTPEREFGMNVRANAHSTSRPIGKLPAFWGRRGPKGRSPHFQRRRSSHCGKRTCRETSRRFRLRARLVLLRSAPMIMSTVRLAISEQHRSEVLRTLRVLMGHATAKAGCAGFSLSAGHERSGGVDDLRPVGDAGGPRRACPLRRVPPASGRHRPVDDASGHQLRRSRAHRRSRPGAGAARPAAHVSEGERT